MVYKLKNINKSAGKTRASTQGRLGKFVLKTGSSYNLKNIFEFSDISLCASSVFNRELYEN